MEDKKIYVEPQCEIIEFHKDDFIRTSLEDEWPNDWKENGGGN